MAERSEPQSDTAGAMDNTHWGVAYLREDLQDLRLQMREDIKDLREQVAETSRSLGQRIDETNKRIDQTNGRIDSRFAWLITTMLALTGILIAVIKL